MEGVRSYGQSSAKTTASPKNQKTVTAQSTKELEPGSFLAPKKCLTIRTADVVSSSPDRPIPAALFQIERLLHRYEAEVPGALADLTKARPYLDQIFAIKPDHKKARYYEGKINSIMREHAGRVVESRQPDSRQPEAQA